MWRRQIPFCRDMVLEWPDAVASSGHERPVLHGRLLVGGGRSARRWWSGGGRGLSGSGKRPLSRQEQRSGQRLESSSRPVSAMGFEDVW